MTIKALITDDLVTKYTEGGEPHLETVPSELEEMGDAELRWTGSAIIEADTLTTFWIDDDGKKHVQNLASNATSHTGTVTFDQRTEGDRIVRASGSWIVDGFTEGSWICPAGSSSNDKTYKVSSLTADYLYTDHTVARLTDEVDASCTVHQGWQRLTSLDFHNPVQKDSKGVWVELTDAERIDLCKMTHRKNLSKAILQFTAGYFDSLRDLQLLDDDVTLQRFAFAYEGSVSDCRAEWVKSWLVNTTSGETTPVTVEMLHIDDAKYSDDIMAPTEADEVSGVTIQFNASQNKIQRTSGWVAAGYNGMMSIHVAGTQYNNGWYQCIARSDTSLTLCDGDSLTQETTDTAVINGRVTPRAYGAWRLAQNGTAWNAVAAGKLEDWMINCARRRWVVDMDTVVGQLRIGINGIEAWAPSTSYAVDDIVADLLADTPDFDQVHICIEAHTSGTGTFADDASKWTTLNELEQLVARCEDFPSHIF